MIQCVPSTGEPLEYEAVWARGQPNGGDIENQANFYVGDGVNDVYGEWSFMAVACEYPTMPILRLRGLCKESNLDSIYTIMNVPNTKDIVWPWNANGVDGVSIFDSLLGIVFVGEFATKIFFNPVTLEWNMRYTWQKYGNPTKDPYGTAKSYQETFALGRHRWNISQEDRWCHNDGSQWIADLKLTGCVDGQFTCDDGQCVRMEERCDQIPNCRDKSDERRCRLLLLEDNYNKKVPPVTTVSSKDFTLVPVPVTVSIILMKIVSMEEVHHSIDFQFGILLQWKDVRLTYFNLKQKSSLNALSDQDIDALWLPRVIYSNTDQKETTKVGETWGWSTSVSVTREGNFTRSGMLQVDEEEEFRGDENMLTMRQVYTHKFQCQYYLQRYPFDTQVCTISMVMGDLDLETVRLLPGTLWMQENVDMTLFVIASWSLEHSNLTQPDKQIRMKIVLKRKIMNELMTTYLPSILLIMITYATTFFKPFFFEAALSVNLTTMLVMTTIFIGVMQMLPSTAYVKMIDVWLIFGQLVPFVEVVLLTIMEFYREGDGSGEDHFESDKITQVSLENTSTKETPPSAPVRTKEGSSVVRAIELVGESAPLARHHFAAEGPRSLKSFQTNYSILLVQIFLGVQNKMHHHQTRPHRNCY